MMEKNNLMNLISEEHKKVIERFNNLDKTVIIDGTNMAYRTVFSAIHFNPEDNEKFFFWKHMMMNSLLNTIKKFQPSKIILAFDSRPSWRYTIYSDYKNKRKAIRDKSVVNFDLFHPVLNSFIEDIKKTFTNFYVMEVESSEADDIIAVLTEYLYAQNKEILIISTDKDMNQLMCFPNVRQYDPLKNKFFQSLNYKQELELKILTGDKSDNIPPIKKKCGIVTATSILQKGLSDFLSNSDKDVNENYIRNKTLIDFNYIPTDIKMKIINKYNSYEKHPINKMKLMSFFTKNRLVKIMETWTQYKEIIDKLS